MKQAKSAIKYVNLPNTEPSRTAIKTHTKPQSSKEGLTKTKQSKQPQPDPLEVKQVYEQGRKAFQELAALHADTQAEATSALRRLDRLEQELRSEREQNARYTAQIASQEQELRKTKEGKRAVEELNSRLNARLSTPSSEATGLRSERDKIRTKYDKLKSERDELQSKHDQVKCKHEKTKTERDQLMQRERSYSDMVQHAERALGICARVCATHAPEISKDIQDTQKTLRDFQESMRA